MQTVREHVELERKGSEPVSWPFNYLEGIASDRNWNGLTNYWPAVFLASYANVFHAITFGFWWQGVYLDLPLVSIFRHPSFTQHVLTWHGASKRIGKSKGAWTLVQQAKIVPLYYQQISYADESID